MVPDPEARFLAALVRVAGDLFGQNHPVAAAAPDDGSAVHAALDAMPEADRDRLLAGVHRLMREDIAAIWSFLPAAGPKGTMH